jgi:hypothetical protein
VRFSFSFGKAEQGERGAALGLPDRFERGDLGRLVLERVQAVQVADDDLQRHQHRGDVHAEAQRLQPPRDRSAPSAAARPRVPRPRTTR